MLDKFQKILSEDANRSFKSHMGNFKSLKEFSDALKEHKENLYSPYVNEHENHFANWIEGVFEDSHLAIALRNAKTVDAALELVEKRLKFAELTLENENFFNNFLPPNPLTNDFTPATDKFHRDFDHASAREFLSSYLKAKEGFSKNLDVASLNPVVKPKKATAKKTVKKAAGKKTRRK